MLQLLYDDDVYVISFEMSLVFCNTKIGQILLCPYLETVKTQLSASALFTT